LISHSRLIIKTGDAKEFSLPFVPMPMQCSSDKASLTEIFDSFLRDGIWNLEEHQAASDWLSRFAQPSEQPFPWALIEACKRAKELEICGIFSNDEFIAEKAWIYSVYSDHDIDDEKKKMFQFSRLQSIENLKMQFEEEILVDPVRARANLEMNKKKPRPDSVISNRTF
jgi:hypothetical protein